MRQLHDEPDELRDAMVKRAEEVAEDLTGTARNLEDFATEDERNNADFVARFDELVGECQTCNWFVLADELCEDSYCDDCCGDVCMGSHDG